MFKAGRIGFVMGDVMMMLGMVVSMMLNWKLIFI